MPARSDRTGSSSRSRCAPAEAGATPRTGGGARRGSSAPGAVGVSGTIPPMQAERRVAVVTGAGSGIGRVVARALLDEGWRVTLAGRREEPLREAAGDAPDALVVPADVRDAASVAALFARTGEAFGRVDLLFNNAGAFGTPAPFGDIAVEEWD